MFEKSMSFGLNEEITILQKCSEICAKENHPL